mmetsp:Transcript_44839/g.100740  ORF Transcript_44839/g.100740 Transcript_44839/m.100740 type:complete len:206 (-) Transcript_44839:81-698(-)
MAGCKFTYFDGAGRATPARVALFKAFGGDWEDERIDWATFQKMKADGDFPLGSVPVLTLKDGRKVVQSEAIARWAGRQGGLYPEDPTEALLVDEAVTTFFEVLGKCPQDPDPEAKKAKREEYAAGWMKVALTTMEKKYSDGGPFLIGSTLTLADLSLYCVVSMIVDGSFDHVPASYMEGFPALSKAAAQVKESPTMVAYYEKYKN